MPKHVGEAWARRASGPTFLDGIGSTEMLHIFLSNRPGDVRYGTSGKPVPGYAVAALEKRRRRADVADGEEGSLWVSGPSACASYWNQREKSLATFRRKPWTRTGDRYVRDARWILHVFGSRRRHAQSRRDLGLTVRSGVRAFRPRAPFSRSAVVGPHGGQMDKLVKPKAFVVLKDATEASGDALVLTELQGTS